MSEMIKSLKKKILVKYDLGVGGAISRANTALLYHYSTASQRASKEGQAYHCGYRSGLFDEHERLKDLHVAMARVIELAEVFDAAGLESALEALEKEVCG